MRKLLAAGTAALALAASTVAAVAPADAQRYGGRGFSGHRGYYGGGFRGYRGGFRGYRGGYGYSRGGLALGAGILGLAAGAAIASSARPYYGGPSYYAPPPPPPPGYYGGCRSAWQWDDWGQRYVRVRFCD